MKEREPLMSYSKTILETDMELLTAALTQRKVSVWSRTADDIYVELEPGGIIRKFTAYSVKINNSYFLREECEFRVRD